MVNKIENKTMKKFVFAIRTQLPNAQAEKIRAIAENQGMTLSELNRSALRLYIESYENNKAA
jgi:hypothetical protein